MGFRSKQSCRVGALFAAALLTSPVYADTPDISARRLLSSWTDGDPSMRMLAEVIASAFASGLSWRGSLAGKEVYCPPPALKGQRIMSALEPKFGGFRFLGLRRIAHYHGHDARFLWLFGSPAG